MANYYEILEVSEKASKEVIEKAYKALAKKYHPDLNQDNRKEAEQKMKQLNEAYDVLMSDDKRANYDNILSKKRELERRKEERKTSHTSNTSNTTNSQSSQPSDDIEKQFTNYNTISYSNNGYYTDNEDNFYVNTAGLSEKEAKKLKEKLQERYLEAYDAYLRERGYKLKYKWTFRRILQVVLTVLAIIVVFTILFFIPPIHKMCIELYEENIIVRLFVNVIKSIFTAIFSIFS